MLFTGNGVLDAILAADSTGVTPGWGDSVRPPLVSDVHITSRTVDKFAMGWLGGKGGTSQFQGVSERLPVLPPSSNRDLEQRIRSSRGLANSHQRLLTRWERPNNFNPGTGTDTWREGENVTWTLTNRGLQDATTGITGPVVYPAKDYTDRDAIAPFWPNKQGMAASTSAPVVMITSMGGTHAGMSLAEMQQAAAAQYTRQRVKRGLIARHHTRTN